MTGSQPRVGLALGAGGARGLTHIGVIKGLLKHGIPIHVLAGSSIGAIIGAMYAATEDAKWVEQRFRAMLASAAYAESGIQWVKAKSPGDEPGFLEWAAQYVRNKIVLNFSDNRPGIVKSERLERVIEFLLPVRTFEELRLPFACCVVDLNTGKDRILDQGDLIQAVLASGTIPGYLPPIPLGDGLLVDGGAGQPIPGSAAKQLGADFIIAIDVAIHTFTPLTQQNILSILGRTSEISVARLAQIQNQQWDFYFQPDTMNLHWTQFDQIDRLIVNGELAVDQHIQQLQRKLNRSAGISRWLRKKSARTASPD